MNFSRGLIPRAFLGCLTVSASAHIRINSRRHMREVAGIGSHGLFLEAEGQARPVLAPNGYAA